MTLLWIALGGALGSVLRYALGGAVQRFSARGFPVGTLAVNVIGCLIVGILIHKLTNDQAHPAARAFMVVGFCGGFTTFSTFSAETIGLMLGGEMGRATIYVLLSVGLCLAATWVGMNAGRTFLR
ncbi:MAG: fluoride efflux transporter CrcB [Gemmatimonadaceae bacterium]|nr:fluoride efflux transporter CrcB [Gemmatimonadaceae bacterium]